MKQILSFVFRFWILLVGALLVTTACQSTDLAQAEIQERGVPQYADTIFLRDTLVIIDKMVFYDSVFVYDTIEKLIITKDTLVLIDTLVIKEVHVKYDTTIMFNNNNFYDTITKMDTLISIDTIYFMDTLVFKDTLVVYDTLFIDSGLHNSVSYFVSIEDIIYGLKPTEKVAFFIRHAERGHDTSVGGGLNENGKKQSKALGESLRQINENIYYMHSNFKRDVETCSYIAEGKKDINFVSDTILDFADASYVLDRNKFESYKSEHGGGWSVVSRWAFTSRFSDAFHDLDEHSEFLEKSYLAPSYQEMPRYSIAVSHDQVVVPFAAWATNRKISLREYETKEWLNYLAGIAIIVNENNQYRYVPVKGLEKGIMIK